MPYQSSSSATLADAGSAVVNRAPLGTWMSTALASVSTDDFRSLLHEHFGFPDFREGQERVLRELAENDVVAVMPTGSAHPGT